MAGNTEKARRRALEGLDMTKRAEDWYGVGLAQRVLGRIAQIEGKLAEAEDRFLEALDTFESIHARFEAGRIHLELAMLAHHRGDRTSLTARLHEAYRLFNALHVPRYVQRVENLATTAEVQLAGAGGSAS